MNQQPENPPPGPGTNPYPGAQPWGQPAQQGWGAPAPGWVPGPQPNAPGQGQQHGYAAPAKPGVVPLRPLGLGDIFDGSFRTLRRNPAATIGVALILELAVGALSLLALGPAGGILLDPTSLDAENAIDDLVGSSMWMVVSGLVGGLLGTLAFLLIQLLCTAPTLRAILNLRTPLPMAWKLGRPRVGQLIVLSLLFLAMFVAGTVLWAGGIYLLFSQVSGGAATVYGVLGALALGVLGLFLSVRLLFAAPAIAGESLGALAALKRSWTLSRGSWWRLFGILALCSIVVGFAVSLLTTPLSLLAGLAVPLIAPGGADDAGPMVLVLMLLTFAVSYLAAGLGAGYLGVVASLLYADLRMRREGLDVVLMAEADAGFNEGIPGTTPLPAQGPLPAAGPANPSPGQPGHGSGQPQNPYPGYYPPQGPVPPPWDAPRR